MVEYITYKKKKYPVRVSYFALKHMAKESGSKEISMENIGNMDIEMYESLLFYSLQAGTKAEETTFSFEKKDMEMILDECLMEFVNLIPKFFPKPQEEEGTAKKKK